MPRAKGWTPERLAKFRATMAAKKQHGDARKGKSNGSAGAIEFPLDAIPERKPVSKSTSGGKALVEARVFAEYDIKTDTMMLVLGKLRLPLRVKT